MFCLAPNFVLGFAYRLISYLGFAYLLLACVPVVEFGLFDSLFASRVCGKFLVVRVFG